MLNLFYDNPGEPPNLDCVGEIEAPDIWAPMYTSTFVPRMAAMMGEANIVRASRAKPELRAV